MWLSDVCSRRATLLLERIIYLSIATAFTYLVLVLQSSANIDKCNVASARYWAILVRFQCSYSAHIQQDSISWQVAKHILLSYCLNLATVLWISILLVAYCIYLKWSDTIWAFAIELKTLSFQWCISTQAAQIDLSCTWRIGQEGYTEPVTHHTICKRSSNACEPIARWIQAIPGT